MKKFKNPKAQALFDEAEKLEEFARKKLEEGVWVEHGPGEWLTEAAGMRALADDIEAGIDNGIDLEDEEWER